MNTTKFNRTMELLVKEAQACVLKDANGNEVLENGSADPQYFMEWVAGNTPRLCQVEMSKIENQILEQTENKK